MYYMTQIQYLVSDDTDCSKFYRVGLIIICKPTHYTMSSLWTTTEHWRWGVAMLLMTSQELVVVLYMKIAVVSLSSESFPPTASSCPCSDTHVDKLTGVSASWCHTLCLRANDKVFSRSPKDCGWQDRRRAASEQVNTDFDCMPL